MNKQEMNLFIDELHNTVQFHSPLAQAENGTWFYGYVEHDISKDKWFAICLTYEKAEDWFNDAGTPDWGMCGCGNTLVEAVNDLKRQQGYSSYPLFNIFKKGE